MIDKNKLNHCKIDEEKKTNNIQEGYAIVEIKIEDSEGRVEFKETIDSIATCPKCLAYCDLKTAFVFGNMHIDIKGGKMIGFICEECAKIEELGDVTAGGTE